MKNLYFGKNNIFIKHGYSTRKNLNEKELNHDYISHILNLDRFSKLRYSKSQKYISNLSLTNRPNSRNKKIFFSNNINDIKTNPLIIKDLKLMPIHRKKLFHNKELDKFNFDIFVNRNNFNNTKSFKKTINQSSQSDFNYDEEDQDDKLRKEHFLKIDKLLNKKMLINKNRPKLGKISFKFNNDKNKLIKNFLKSNYKDVFNKKLNLKLKPLQYYFKCLNNKENKDIKDNKCDQNQSKPKQEIIH